MSNKQEISSKLLETPKKIGRSAAKSVEYKYDSDYLIYNDGRVYSKKANRFLTGKIDNVGYRTYRLAIINPTTGKKGKMEYAHRLVAEHFIPNPDNKPIVHHIDGDKLNNHVNNLEWVTYSENSSEFHSKNTVERDKPKYYKKDLDGEIWKTVLENPKYSVSNMGRVRNNNTNRLIKPADKTTTYIRVRLGNGSERKSYYLHRLVYCTFHNDYDLESYVIDHIDNNPKNNRLDNLQKLTHSENNYKRFQH